MVSRNQQYTCPDCGAVGAHPKELPPPYCHVCDYKVKMKPSSNGRIIEEVCGHKWVERDIRDKEFGVCFGKYRECSLCGEKQHIDYTEGRIGGCWKTVKKKEV